jgi:non-SMC mitotic condensation complex subunit 1
MINLGYIEKIAFHLGRRDEVPNQELAADLAANEDIEGILEIASALKDKNKSIQSDCIKVLYEIGYVKPELIVKYIDDFLYHLNSRNNRLVWGSMIACATIASLVPEKMMDNFDLIKKKTDSGTVITHIWGIYTFINICKAGIKYKEQLFPVLLKYCEECRPVDFAKRIESVLEIMEKDELPLITSIVEKKRSSLSDAQYKRAVKALKRRQ